MCRFPKPYVSEYHQWLDGESKEIINDLKDYSKALQTKHNTTRMGNEYGKHMKQKVQISKKVQIFRKMCRFRKNVQISENVQKRL